LTNFHKLSLLVLGKPLSLMIKYMVLLIKKYCLKLIDMDILTLGWVGVLSLFTWSIAMVVWGRKGF